MRVWPEGQEDQLIAITADEEEDRCRFTINFADFGYQQGRDKIELYGVSDTKEQYMIRRTKVYPA